MTPDRLREIMFALAFLLVPVFLVGAAELVLHIRHASNDRESFDWSALRKHTMIDQAARHSLFRPGSEWGNVKFNSHGLRSPEIEARKPTDTIRLAFLGDSVTMTAELPEEQTFPAGVSRLLQARHPNCRFDYFTFAGPSYSTTFIAENWPSLAAKFTPDITVMILGSPFEVAGRIRPDNDQARNARNPQRDYELTVVKKLRQYQRRLALDQFLPGLNATTINEAAIETALADMQAALAEIIVEDQSILIGHRGRIRDTGTLLERMDQTSRLHRKLGAESTISAVELLQRTLSAMAETVRAGGGRFSDAQAKLPADFVHYLDAHHLSAAGAEALAEAILPDIEPLLPDCASDRSGS